VARLWAQALRTFDPECVLAALYSMEGVVRAIAEGSWEPTARHCPQPPTRYSAEDAAGGELYEEEVLWEDHYDYADDYYEDSRPLGRGRYGGGECDRCQFRVALGNSLALVRV
jgi:hypothetical protein